VWPWYPHETRDAAVTHRETPSNPSRTQDTPLQRFGATLRQYRQQRRLSQQALAVRTGIRRSYIGQIERGLRNVSVLALLRLAHALDIPAAWLLARLDTRAPLALPVTYTPLPPRGAREVAVPDARTLFIPPGDQATLLALLGATLRQYRQQRRLSQRELAARTSLAASYICDIEQGQRNISVLSLVRIAEALELSIAYLLAPLETHLSPSH